MPVPCYDRNKERCYELARIAAAKLIENPSLIEEGRKYLERHVKSDPAQKPYYVLWLRLLERPPEEIASRLLADSVEGSLLRDTRPVFHIPSQAERNEARKRVRRHLS